MSKIGQGKCIVSRNGAQNNAPQPLLSIQHHPPSNNNHSERYNNNDSPRSSNHDDWSNSPSHNQQNEGQMANGVVEEIVNGRKIVDMTSVKQAPYQKPPAYPSMPNMMGIMAHQMASQVSEEEQSQSMANQAMMYSQQMNYYAQMGMPPFMPMWPGQQPMWPMPGATGAAPPPPPPPPPPVSTVFFHSF